MRFFKDKLPKGLIYPCGVGVVKEFLKAIPDEDLSGIKSIRFTYKKRSFFSDGCILHGGRIQLAYAVDERWWRRIFGIPPEKLLEKWESFGGKYRHINGESYLCWEPEGLKKYIKFVLFHEIGHNVYCKKYGNVNGGSMEEKFADRYARRYLNR